jgi:hypothetical protein
MSYNERLHLHETNLTPMTAPSYSPYYSVTDDQKRYSDDPYSQNSSYVGSRTAHADAATSYIYGPYGVPDSSMSSMPRPSHHHHHLPDTGRSSASMLEEHGQDSYNLVGQEGMPSPARRPQRPRVKFSKEEDELLIELKEKRHLTWKQIADFFPGRNPGTLQVRYCTRLKTEGTSWTREMVCNSFS